MYELETKVNVRYINKDNQVAHTNAYISGIEADGVYRVVTEKGLTWKVLEENIFPVAPEEVEAIESPIETHEHFSSVDAELEALDKRRAYLLAIKDDQPADMNAEPEIDSSFNVDNDEANLFRTVQEKTYTGDEVISIIKKAFDEQ